MQCSTALKVVPSASLISKHAGRCILEFYEFIDDDGGGSWVSKRMGLFVYAIAPASTGDTYLYSHR